MTCLPRARARAVQVRPDAGLTLVELLVSMIVLTFFLGIFGTAVLGLVRSSRQHTNTVAAQSGIRLAFLRLDKQIRYADGVTTPGTIAGDQWIEWRVPDPSIPSAQSATQTRCYQWRASSSSGLLQYRSWVVPTSGAASATAWATVLSGLTIGSQPVFTTATAGLIAAPFSLPSTLPTYGAGFARVGVALTASVGSPPGRSSVATVFPALNSRAAASTVCAQVARV